MITIHESSPIVLSFCDAIEKFHSAESTFEFNTEISYRGCYLCNEVELQSVNYPLLDVVSVLQVEEFTRKEETIADEDVFSVLKVEEFTRIEE